MKATITILLLLLLSSCNMVRWNQKRLTRKYERNGIHENTFVSGGDTIHYFDGGQGEVVMLLQGFGADAQMNWNQSIQDLVKDHRVIAPDLLWFGKSSSNRKPALDSQIAALLKLLDKLHIGQCSVVGISYGGFVSLGMAYQHPDRVKKLCLVDSPGMTYDVNLLDSLCAIQHEKNYQDIFVLRTVEDLQELVDLSAYHPRKVPKMMCRHILDVYYAENAVEQYELLTSLPAEKNSFDGLKPDNFPETCIIWGDSDRVFPLSEAKKLAEYMGAELKIVPDAGHASNLDNFKVFEAYLREFLGGD